MPEPRKMKRRRTDEETQLALCMYDSELANQLSFQFRIAVLMYEHKYAVIATQYHGIVTYQWVGASRLRVTVGRKRREFKGNVLLIIRKASRYVAEL